MTRAAFAMLFGLTPLVAQAGMFAKEEQSCGDQPNTVAIVACLDAKAKVWDQRLNAAYRSLGQVVDPEQRDPLRAAQRSWLQYRDANCRFYAAHQGTISQVLAAECLRSMTQERALELEQARRP